MFNQPHRAKRLFFDVIPRAVDEYLANAREGATRRRSAALRPIRPGTSHGGRPGDASSPVPFGMLLNLASVVNADTPEMLWGFIAPLQPGRLAGQRAVPGAAGGPRGGVLRDFVRPTKRFRAPDATERAALADLAAALRAMPAGATAEAIQDEVYAVGKRHPFPEPEGLVPVPVSGAAGPAGGAAVRRVRGAVWHAGDGGADRSGVWRRCRTVMRDAGGLLRLDER